MIKINHNPSFHINFHAQLGKLVDPTAADVRTNSQQATHRTPCWCDVLEEQTSDSHSYSKLVPSVSKGAEKFAFDMSELLRAPYGVCSMLLRPDERILEVSIVIWPEVT